jgi:hypothetical protein
MEAVQQNDNWSELNDGQTDANIKPVPEKCTSTKLSDPSPRVLNTSDTPDERTYDHWQSRSHWDQTQNWLQ